MSIVQDIRFGWRILAKSPGFTLAAVGAIALGIGVNSMMFTIYNAALFNPLNRAMLLGDEAIPAADALRQHVAEGVRVFLAAYATRPSGKRPIATARRSRR